ncbi:MAG: NfeD family protein [Leptolyngbya sp. SIO1E4]|nr:NfeD family protein [Leptolyngbya sp. SIO1E4]
MNLLKALFNTELEDTNFFENTYPLTNDFFDSFQEPWQEGTDALAVVRSPICSGRLGHVRFHGVRWRASCDRPTSIPVGTKVRVLGRRANILIVEPLDAPISSHQADGGMFNIAAATS